MSEGSNPQAPWSATAVPVKVIIAPDGTSTEIPTSVPYDAQAREQRPLTEAQGWILIRLLSQLVAIESQANGILPPTDDPFNNQNNG